MKTNNPENSDRELLELAAKAAGYERNSAGPVGPCGWNPLEDDGDSLRLAVKLGITISFWGHLEEVATCTPDDGTPAAQESYSQGRDVAARRAIVRAAAEMGRDKP